MYSKRSNGNASKSNRLSPYFCSLACGSPADKDGYLFGGPDPDATCGSTVTVKCADGYVADPVIPPLTCQAGGSWTTPTGCKRISMSIVRHTTADEDTRYILCNIYLASFTFCIFI